MAASLVDVDFVLDMRCLQDEGYATRGIGRHSLNLLRQAPRNPGTRFIGLVDPDLPELTPDTRDLLDCVRTNSYTGTLNRPVYFIEFSPMTHDPLFNARMLHHPAPLKVAVVYDFIPWDDAPRYLPSPAQRLSYHTSLHWLAQYDLFMPISKAAAARLANILHVDADRVTVTGVPLDPAFEQNPRRGKASHLLVVGGDWRKNPECAVRAHAQAEALQRMRVPIVLTGGYAAWRKDDLRALAQQHGGDPDLLTIHPHVTEALLLDLYRDAICVITPSRAEGFSLPVIEAMASGVPAIASRIPAHEELIDDPELLFEPEDDARLASILSGLVCAPAVRDAIVAAQATVWPRFNATRVATRFWQAIATYAELKQPAAPAVQRGHRPRIAMMSPIPPSRSGIADYTAATLAGLRPRADIHIFTGTEDPAPLPEAVPVHPLSRFPYVSSDFDRVVGVVGNSHFHIGIIDNLLRFGGAAIVHDARMTDFYWYLRGKDRAAQQASRELGRPVAVEEVKRWLDEPNTLEALFLGEIAQAAAPLCFHATRSIKLVRDHYNVDAVRLPFCVYRGWEADQLTPRHRSDARRRLGLSDAEIALVSFGHLHYTKAPEDCIWSMEILRSWGIPATLAFAGGVHMDVAPLRKLASQLGLEDRVRFSDDYTDEALYRDWLLAADIGLQLRSMTFGSISGALMDCVTAGLPTVANEDLAGALDAPDYVRRVNDKFNPVLIAEAAAELIEAGLHSQRPEEARLAYAEEHSPAVYADRLLSALGLAAS
jgi:glycosyltransferase involved in cell wall biosynthesis